MERDGHCKDIESFSIFTVDTVAGLCRHYARWFSAVFAAISSFLSSPFHLFFSSYLVVVIVLLFQRSEKNVRKRVTVWQSLRNSAFRLGSWQWHRLVPFFLTLCVEWDFKIDDYIKKSFHLEKEIRPNKYKKRRRSWEHLMKLDAKTDGRKEITVW